MPHTTHQPFYRSSHIFALACADREAWRRVTQSSGCAAGVDSSSSLMLVKEESFGWQPLTHYITHDTPHSTMARNDYEPINDTRGVEWGIEAGAENNNDLYQADANNPFGNHDARIHRSASSAQSDPSRRSILWWVVAPAVTLLVVIAVAVAVVSQSAIPLPASAGSPLMPTLGATGPSSTTTGHDNNMLPSTYAMVDESSTGMPREGAVDTTTPTTAQKPGPKMNATTVLSCLEDKCEPLVNQLGKSWRELANINLLRCLASSAFNKTEAGVCFDHASPSDLRDDLVACAGCSKCIKLKDQAGVEKACAKYHAWAAKQKANATAPALEAAVEKDDEVLLLQQGPTADSLAANLPASLKEKFCSQYWCP